MDEKKDNIIVLSDEQGNDIEFEFMDLIEYNEKQYVVLLPVDDDEVAIMEVENIDAEVSAYNSVDDEDVLDAVFEIFKENFKDRFDFVD